jgi:hypothetical protein
MLPAPVAIGLVVLCVLSFICAGYGANATVSAIVTAINAASGPDQQESRLVWHPAKYLRVFGRYRALFPDGVLLRRLRCYQAWSWATFIVLGLLLFAAAG